MKKKSTAPSIKKWRWYITIRLTTIISLKYHDTIQNLQLALPRVHHQGSDICPITGTTKVANFDPERGGAGHAPRGGGHGRAGVVGGGGRTCCAGTGTAPASSPPGGTPRRLHCRPGRNNLGWTSEAMLPFSFLAMWNMYLISMPIRGLLWSNR